MAAILTSKRETALVLGQRYSRQHIEDALQIRFGYQINGIVVRNRTPKSEKRLILLFSRSDGPYSDRIAGDTIKYDGAGLRGDQLMTGVNRVLAERGRTDGFYFFHQASGETAWTYLGRGHVVGFQRVRKHGRTMIEFDLKLESVTNRPV